eukprot:3058386-Prymnesium_polylepis.1
MITRDEAPSDHCRSAPALQHERCPGHQSVNRSGSTATPNAQDPHDNARLWHPNRHVPPV